MNALEVYFMVPYIEFFTYMHWQPTARPLHSGG
jgi:hypothetical protein